MASSQPYLSIVVTARNDDHGGNLLGRMQAFVNGWLKQARRYDLDSELIFVEWNPPDGRPRLRDALRWPDAGRSAVRIIEVPAELHRRYAHADALPLYQMIGKNVGIRRARGQFVLATNIDILFSAELVRFLAEHRLDPARMYRIDRHDVMSDVPVDADPGEQQAYCDSHVIRVNRREGTFSAVPRPNDSSAAAAAVPKPVADDGLLCDGVRCGDGWFAPERHTSGEAFRWAGAEAGLDIERGRGTLVLDVEPGPGGGGQPIDLEILAGTQSIGRFAVTMRGILRIQADWSGKRCGLVFRTHNELSPLAQDPRSLAFRVLQASWQGNAGKPGPPTASFRRIGWARRAAALWNGINHLVARMEAEAPVASFSVMVSPGLRRILRTYMKWTSVPQLESAAATELERKRKQEIPPPAMLHTNACGDFTLLARQHWIELRGYAEFDLYSMNLDSLFCYAAHHAGVLEEMLEDPMRIYHIEHGSGSGWTPEGQQKLYARLAAAGLSFLEMDTVLSWGAHMRWLNSPMLFNREDWGLAAFDLRESVVTGTELS